MKPDLRARLSDAIAINTESLPDFTNSWFLLVITTRDEYGIWVPTFVGISLSYQRDRISQMLSFYKEMGFKRPFYVLSDLNKHVVDAVKLKFGFN